MDNKELTIAEKNIITEQILQNNGIGVSIVDEEGKQCYRCYPTFQFQGKPVGFRALLVSTDFELAPQFVKFFSDENEIMYNRLMELVQSKKNKFDHLDEIGDLCSFVRLSIKTFKSIVNELQEAGCISLDAD